MKTKKKAPAKAKTATKPTLIVMLLDRSGSMSSCKAETISGFNAYVRDLKASPKDGSRFTFVQFDSMGVDTIQDAVPVERAKDLTDTTYEPRANTPLFDAIGQTIRNVQSKAKDHKVLFVVQTDGQENASSEYTEQSAKALILDMETHQHWTFAYIGTGIHGWNAAQKMAFGTMSVSNVMRTTGGQMVNSVGSVLSRATRKYRSSASGQCVATSFYADEEDQTK